MARPKKLTDAQIKQAIFEAGGILSQAAKLLGCIPQNLSYHIAKKKHLREYMESFLPSVKIAAESSITQAIYEGNITASMFFLKCKGGYQEKQNIELSGNKEAPVSIEWVIVEKAEDTD